MVTDVFEERIVMTEAYVPSTWRRLFAYSMDQLVVLPFYLPFAGIFLRLFFTDDEVVVNLTQLLVLYLIPAVFEVVFLVLMQATPGKWLMGLKVVPATNYSEKLHWSQCLLRPLAGRLSFFFSVAIYAVAFFRYDRTHLCDWIAETRVVQGTPRPKKAQIRWILGTLVVLLYVYEGMVSARMILKSIDWQERQADLREVFDLQDYVDVSFE
ncbi:RDD family protein [Bdellovibrio bacteriovorus]|uniref:RDD family protein n=1 Tax=Bdellovibrio bacteriovorus TaxID=959 RepID=UPI0021CE9F3E|nr:RDD family protein [Bdellovibrio bacteriovorus]UXR63688.1 RDD family protein [Bdellovibrio bacteriovorus]